MNGKQLALSAVLAGFAVLNGVAVYEYGYIGFVEAAVSSFAGVMVMIDLTISLTLALIWMARDAKQTGISTLPYVVLTFAFGSIGLLLYLIRREGTLTAKQAHLTRAAA